MWGSFGVNQRLCQWPDFTTLQSSYNNVFERKCHETGEIFKAGICKGVTWKQEDWSSCPHS